MTPKGNSKDSVIKVMATSHTCPTRGYAPNVPEPAEENHAWPHGLIWNEPKVNYRPGHSLLMEGFIRQGAPGTASASHIPNTPQHILLK
jgi:hypothetical protein